MSVRISAMVVLAVLVFPFMARAQVVRPFFPAGATAYTPQIDVVTSGVLNDVQATVSHDRKYVTLTMRADNTQLLALHTFQFGGTTTQPAAGGGVIGGAQLNGAAGAFGAINPPVVLGPGKGAALLAQRGMTPIVSGR